MHHNKYKPPQKRVLLWLLFFCLTASVSQAQEDILIPYRSGTQWSFADTTGQVVIHPQYGKVQVFIISKTNGRYVN